jgi:hypothetical protein
MKRSAKWWIGLGALVGLGLLWACSVLPTTHEWREEVALHDGGMIVMKWRVRVDPGPFGLEDGVGPARLTFSTPQQVGRSFGGLGKEWFATDAPLARAR